MADLIDVLRRAGCELIRGKGAFLIMTAALSSHVSAQATDGGDEEYLKVLVNRVALEAIGPKSAIVESNVTLADGRFSVLVNGERRLSAALKPLPDFPDWGKDRHYYLADFSSLTETGRYLVRAQDDTVRAASGTISVGKDALFRKIAPTLVHYFSESRWLDAGDHDIGVYGTDRRVDAWGGWKDAGGDNGKYLSHLSYANFMNPQQAGLTAWALARSYDASPDRFRSLGLANDIVEEAFWGADFMHRMLSPEGYFYMTVFEGWGRLDAPRVITGYVGEEGIYTGDYHAAFREGGGMAIAALSRAARLARSTGKSGAFAGSVYLADAERAFAHLSSNNTRYDDNGKDNIIDDYCALIAAVELAKSTEKLEYQQAADARAASLMARMTPGGWWRSDDGERPYYHGVEAGMPVLALSEYLDIASPANQQKVRATIRQALDAQVALDDAVTNIFDYPRQQFRTYANGHYGPLSSGFFMPHANETGYWWQGESARLSSLAVAAVVGGRAIGKAGKTFGVSDRLAQAATHRLDWTLGRNPYDISMLYGFGQHNPAYTDAGGFMLVGGISNGITGAFGDDEGRGIAFSQGPEQEKWRWNEQWMPHTTWMLLAVSLLNSDEHVSQ